MIWKKIPRRVQIYSFVAFLLSCVFCSFGLSSDVSATTNTCEFDQLYSSGSSVLKDTYCPNIIDNIDPNAPVWLSYDITFVSANTFNNSSYYTGFAGYTLIMSSYFPLYSSNSLTSWHFVGTFSFPNFNQYCSYLKFYDSDSVFTSRHYKLSLSDTDPSSGGSSESCPDCPPIPENPYDNKLDDIKKAIYVCGATLLVLYFFFCIYKIVVKDGGSR